MKLFNDIVSPMVYVKWARTQALVAWTYNPPFF
jgi:hypothetical protein